MIGKPEWFTRRKYGGWGLYPKTWHGWVYTLLAILPIIGLQYATFLSEKIRMVATIVWAVVLMADFLDIMIRMKKDEREKIHEAFAERNALWAIIIVIAIGVGYQASTSIVSKTIEVDPFLIAAVLVGLIVKAASNIYLDRKD